MWSLKDPVVLNEKFVLCVSVLVVVPGGRCKNDRKVQECGNWNNQGAYWSQETSSKESHPEIPTHLSFIVGISSWKLLLKDGFHVHNLSTTLRKTSQQVSSAFYRWKNGGLRDTMTCLNSGGHWLWEEPSLRIWSHTCSTVSNGLNKHTPIQSWQGIARISFPDFCPVSKYTFPFTSNRWYILQSPYCHVYSNFQCCSHI